MKIFPLLGSFFALSGLVAVAACSSDDASGGGATTDAGTGSETSTPTPTPTPPPGATDAGSDATSNASLGAGPYTLAYAGRFAGVDFRPIASGKATFDGLKLTGYEFNAQEKPTSGTNQVKDTSGDSFVFLGRWAGGSTGGQFYTAGDAGVMDFAPNGGLHYAIGRTTDPIPSSGAATYTLLAKTPVTVSDGTVAPGTFSGTLAANLAGANTKVGVDFTLDLPGDATYAVKTTGGSADTSATEAIIPTGGSIKGAFVADITITSAGAACTGGATCHGVVQGFMAGPNAERIGLVVHIFAGEGGAAKTVSAAAVYQKQ